MKLLLPTLLTAILAVAADDQVGEIVNLEQEVVESAPGIVITPRFGQETTDDERHLQSNNLPDLIVDFHNAAKRRASSTCPPVNSRKYTYSSYLASVAREHAEKCVFEHNYDRPNGLGENVAVSYGSGHASFFPTLSTFTTDALTGWEDEKQWYNYENKSCRNGRMCGHYTQMVWASSHQVGCHVADCAGRGNYAGWSYARLLVCNYSPAGNVVGQRPYRTGTECALCPNNCDNGLCTAAPEHVPECEDKTGFEFRFSGTSYTTCSALVNDHPNICNTWTTIRSYCRVSCDTCVHRDGLDGCDSNATEPPTEPPTAPPTPAPTDSSAIDEPQQDEPSNLCENLAKRPCKRLKGDVNGRRKKICRFKRGQCIPR